LSIERYIKEKKTCVQFGGTSLFKRWLLSTECYSVALNIPWLDGSEVDSDDFSSRKLVRDVDSPAEVENQEEYLKDQRKGGAYQEPEPVPRSSTRND